MDKKVTTKLEELKKEFIEADKKVEDYRTKALTEVKSVDAVKQAENIKEFCILIEDAKAKAKEFYRVKNEEIEKLTQEAESLSSIDWDYQVKLADILKRILVLETYRL